MVSCPLLVMVALTIAPPYLSGEGKESSPVRGGSAEQGAFFAMLLAQLVLLYPLRRGLGERRAELPQAWHLKLRQPLRRKRAQLLCRHRLLRHHERLDLLPEHRIRQADHRHLRDARMLAQRLLDQHRRHVLAAAPDDVALAVDEVEPAVLVDEAEVAGQEPAVPQGGRRRLGVAEVRRQARGRADRNLARPARRERAAPLVEDAEPDARGRRAARGP